MDPVAPPPSLHPLSYPASHQQQEADHGPSYVAVIVLPIIAAAILLLGILVLFLILRVKWKSNDGSGIGSSFRRCSFDEMKLGSRCSPNVRLSGIGYSPDVRSCIYGGKMVFAPQAGKKGWGQVFTYKELELATDGFSERNIIGNGRYGVVYKGGLRDGTTAAIKLLNVEGKQGEREFRMEVDLLSRLQSNYLIGLLGYCADQHHRLLVFEIMSNGSLQKNLHSTTSKEDQICGVLDWRTRLKIALDSSRGLEFLHERSVPAVIHRDFKSSKILLDQNFCAKISNSGIAKTCSYKTNGVKIQGLGTTGYVAPDYASNGKLSTKSDVYSYGVVLLELLTGRVPVDITRPQGEHVLVSWALPRLTNREKVMEMVDPALKGQYSRKELIQVAAIAAMCVQSEADYRPLITDVVQSLIPIVKSTSTTCPTPARFKEDQVSITTR